MIHSLYIINQAGIAIYSEHFVKSNVDEQLLSGFLTAIGSFSQEAIGGQLQKLHIKTGEQMVLYYHEESRLTIVAIANAADNQNLLESLLNKIIKEFYKTYRKYLREEGLFEDTSLFRKSCLAILAGRSAKRGKKELIVGLFLGLILLIFVVALSLSWFLQISGIFANEIQFVITISNWLANDLLRVVPFWDPTNVTNWIQAQLIIDQFFDKAGAMQAHFFNMSVGAQLILILNFTPSSFLGGYIAGSRKNGRWIGFLFFGLAIGFMLLFAQGKAFSQLLYYVAVYSPLILISCFLFGYVGGLIREMKYLYPLPPERKLDAYKGEEIQERGIKTTFTYIFGVFGAIFILIGLSVFPFFIFGAILIGLAIFFEIQERKKF